MRTEECVPSKYVDGVEKLHAQLHEEYLKAMKIANRFLGFPTTNPERHEAFSIFVDFNEAQPLDRLRGFFISRKTIMRFLPIEFDYALLFPVHNHGGGDFKQAHGITYAEIKEAINKRERVRITFRSIPTIEDKVLYSVDFLNSEKMTFAPLEKMLDDVGLPYSNFSDIDSLSLIDVPDGLGSQSYSLVGKQHYAPYTTDKECHCVLFAQKDNEYDTNAIKVLRWFPVKKGIEVEQLLGFQEDGGDIFFELGYISREENGGLHDFMVDSNSRILFGKAVDNKISITGGVKLFMENEFKYPRSLYNIKLK